MLHAMCQQLSGIAMPLAWWLLLPHFFFQVSIAVELNAALIWALQEVAAAAAWFGRTLSELADIAMKSHLAL